jgi:capsular polysaccharide biosynthesis protein
MKGASASPNYRRIPEKPETAYSTDRQVAGLASGPREQKPKGRPLEKDRPKSLAATKPWEAAEMSRATWFRRQKEARSRKETV